MSVSGVGIEEALQSSQAQRLLMNVVIKRSVALAHRHWQEYEVGV